MDRALVDLAGFYRDVVSPTPFAAPSTRCTPTRLSSSTAAAGSGPVSALRRLKRCSSAAPRRGQRQAAHRRRGMMLALWRG
jgi:hypothetical protein